MPKYTYHARNDDGDKISGELLANDLDELTEKLEGMNLFLISAKEAHEVKSYTLSKKVKRKDLLTFTIYLNTLISAGVPLLVGLQQIAEQTEDPYFKKVIFSILDDIRGGRNISEAMEKHPKVFDGLYTSVIKAGESSGSLEMVLNDLAAFLEWQDDLNKEVRKATVYPCVLLGTVGSLVLVLIVFVFPRFMKMFTDINMDLPGPTLLVISLSTFVNNYWHLLIGSLVTFIVSYKVAYRYDQGRVFIDRYKMHLPIVGVLVTKIAVSRFAHYLGLMLRAGVSLVESFEIVEKVVGNAAIAQVVHSMRDMVLGGEKISQAMERYTEFPPLVVQMIAVGEMSGKLEDNLNKVSKFYDREVPETIHKTLGAIQPLMIVFMAGVIIIIALAIFLPMFQMAGAAKKG
ncbi:MAG: type II secretion system F family protein [Candidatus Schekmanbacteria bacterium]|nr:type II secretion system F family protein [Candidatus Schekmanbacteria bacterium]